MAENLKSKNVLWIYIVGVVLIGGAFFFGKSYGLKHPNLQNSFTRGGSINSQAGQYRGMMNGNGQNGAINGSIDSIDGNSMVVKGSDGSSKIVIVSSSSEIMKSDIGTMSDLLQGKNISVRGKTNSDGSVTATSIQILSDKNQIRGSK